MPLTTRNKHKILRNEMHEYARMLSRISIGPTSVVLATPKHILEARYSHNASRCIYYHLCIVPDNAYKPTLDSMGMAGMYFMPHLLYMLGR